MQKKVIHHFHFKIPKAGVRLTKHLRLAGIPGVGGRHRDLVPISFPFCGDHASIHYSFLKEEAPGEKAQ